MESSGYGERSDDDVTPPTGGGVQGEDEPVQEPDVPERDREQAEDQA